MFICAECREKNGCFHVVPVSYGPCEVCGKNGECFDCGHSHLPRTVAEMEREPDAAFRNQAEFNSYLDHLLG